MILPHPPFSPDLASTNFFVFYKIFRMEKFLRTFFKKGLIDKLPRKFEKVVQSGEHKINKYNFVIQWEQNVVNKHK